MGSLVFLMVRRVKNTLRELLRRPGKLILYIFIIGMAAFTMVTANTDGHAVSLRNEAELHAIVLLFYAFIFVITAAKGFGSGASFYLMADLHFVFPMPFSSVKVLVYGLVRQMGVTLLAALLLIFQYSWLHQLYGLTPAQLVIILVFYAVCVFCAQLAAMCIYSFTSGSDRGKKAAKTGFVALCALYAGYVLLPMLDGGSLIADCVPRANSAFASTFPVAGWLAAVCSGIISGGAVKIAAGLAAAVIFSAVMIILIIKAKGDYYEDVILATEVSHSAITARKEGVVRDIVPAKVKVGKTGIGRGAGASAFYYKHLLESRRASPIMLDFMSLLFVAFIIGWAYMMRDMGIVPVFIFGSAMQVFTVSTGRFGRELMLPYAYLVPEKPFIKLLNLCRESILKSFIEALLIFVPMAFILSLSPEAVAVCVLARVSFGTLFMGANLLIERLLGASTGKMLIMTCFFIAVMILAAPGIAGGIIFGMLMDSVVAGSGFIYSFLLMAVINAAVSAAVLFACRNMLSHAELNNR